MCASSLASAELALMTPCTYTSFNLGRVVTPGHIHVACGWLKADKESTDLTPVQSTVGDSETRLVRSESRAILNDSSF